MNRTVYILRGLPGSGKSFVADSLAQNPNHGMTFSADNYFYVNGVYKFDASQLGRAHESCRNSFYDRLKLGESLIVDNTHTRKWEYEWYLEQAKEYGYDVQIITIQTDLSDEELAKRNVHGVPAETIRKMRQRFEY